ncbi:MAG TPA: DUF4136 domain-containing protein [Hymenobacter sp.]|jgi:hypothetical protein
MKPLSITFILLAACLITSCSSSEEVAVGSEQRGGYEPTNGVYNSTTTSEANFDSYKTYGWATQVNDSTNVAFFVDDLSYKSIIRKAVAQQMAAHGYTYQPGSPDLVVNFRVFDHPTDLREDANDDYWTANEYRPNDALLDIKLDKGSVIVQLADRKKSDVVWQGYASGLFNGDAMNKEQTKVNQTIAKVFAEYTHRGDNL